MITGQLRASDPRKDQQAQLADESGINATLFYGTASVVVQLSRVGQVVVTYEDSLTGERKSVFLAFMNDLALTNQMASTERDGTITVE